MTIPALKKMQRQQPRTFAMKFDALCQLYGDPLAGLFALAYGTQDEEVRLRALAELLPYRHPRLKQVEHTGDGRTGPQVVMQINMSPSQAAQVAQLAERPGLSRALLPTLIEDRSIRSHEGGGGRDLLDSPASPGPDDPEAAR